jgi:HD-like signal output (HDOD) protein
VDLHTLTLKIQRSENLPVLPTVVVQILRLFDDPTVSPRTLEKIIEQDPALTAKLLRIAGSSMYGMQSATSVARALSVLGMNTLRSISISLAYQQVMELKVARPAYDRLAFWRHSLAVAIASRGLMRMLNPVHAEEVYIAGLMHDIGVLALEKFSPLMLTQAVRRASANDIPLVVAERHFMDFDHSDLGAVLAQTWKLNSIITHAIKFHNDPFEDETNFLTTMAVAAGNRLAHECGFPEMNGVPCVHGEEDILPKLDLSSEQVDSVRKLIIDEVEKMDSSIGSKRSA